MEASLIRKVFNNVSKINDLHLIEIITVHHGVDGSIKQTSPHFTNLLFLVELPILLSHCKVSCVASFRSFIVSELNGSAQLQRERERIESGAETLLSRPATLSSLIQL
jgi:hypothetical protein